MSRGHLLFPCPKKVLLGAFSDAEIVSIADRQKAMIWLILASLIAMGIGFVPFSSADIIAIAVPQNAKLLLALASLERWFRFFAVNILSMIFVYRLARSVRSSIAGAYAALSLIPFVGVVVLLIVNSEATVALKSRGVRVGLMGANKQDIGKLVAS